MEYYAMYKIPEIAKFRAMVTDVRHTDEMSKMTGHWAAVTQQTQHQVVVKHQAELIMAAINCIKMTDEDKQWMSPKKSPVMFEAFHALYLYFVAMGKGDLEPMLDFMIDGKYEKNFVKHVKPDFGAPGNLYLYWIYQTLTIYKDIYSSADKFLKKFNNLIETKESSFNFTKFLWILIDL